MEPQQSSRAGAAARRHFIGGEWVDCEGEAMPPSLVPFTGEAVAEMAAGRRSTVQSGSHPFPF
jgi:hypothetical protein